jgi:hypothetical protein
MSFSLDEYINSLG